MITRILSSLVFLPLLFIIYIGNFPLYLLELILGIFAIYEIYKCLSKKDIFIIKPISYIFIIYLPIKNYYKINTDFTLFILFILFIVGILFVLNKKYSIIDFFATFFAILYIGIFMDHIILIRDSFNLGYIYIWLLFIISISSDTFAYFIGYLFGKHKLIPHISPNKTIEGSLGGIIASMVSCMIFGYIFKFNLLFMIIIGALGSIISQIGDLFASSIKRFAGIKDFSNLIPGHGGVLDRLDSAIVLAPFIYYMILYLIL